MKAQLSKILHQAPVMPVLVIHDLADAVPLAKALRDGGLPVLEVTLRTPQGLEAIRLIRNEVADVIVGVGTVTNTAELDAAIAAGSEFIVTPGHTRSLLRAGIESKVPFLPGVSTVSELMNCLEQGLDILKFFPAQAAGGAAALKAFAGPFPQASFCPTGGIGPGNIGDYLALPSVLSVGGSWVAPEPLLAEKNWSEITQCASVATALVASVRDNLA